MAVGEHALCWIAVVVCGAGAVGGTADATILLSRCEEGEARKEKEGVEEHGGKGTGDAQERDELYYIAE